MRTLVAPDVIKGSLLVTLFGQEVALVENYKSMIGYTDSQIKLQGKDCKVLIKGKNMKIERFGGMDCKIIGWIESVEYLWSEKGAK